MVDNNVKHCIISYLSTQSLSTRIKQAKKFRSKFDRLTLHSVLDESSSIVKPNLTLKVSSCNFSNAELAILVHGLNYALGKCTVDTSKLLASIELTISKLNNKNKHSIHTDIFKILLKKKISVSPDFNSE